MVIATTPTVWARGSAQWLRPGFAAAWIGAIVASVALLWTWSWVPPCTTCGLDGRCALVATEGGAIVCAATTAGHCAHSVACALSGTCEARQGVCVTSRCRSTHECWRDGRCELERGMCVANLRTCSTSAACIEDGRCIEDNGRCVADDGTRCRTTIACTHNGACASGPHGRCVVGAASDCAASNGCAQRGACGLVTDGEETRCGPTAPDHCHSSDECRQIGRCTLVAEPSRRPLCLVGEGDCATLCKEQGRCHPSSQRGSCVALSDEDCKASVRCQRRGACTMHRGTCQRSEVVAKRREAEERASGCAATEECRATGHCTRRGNACVVGSDDDCRDSTGCHDEGRCRAVSGRCIAKDDTDCQRSVACTFDNRCFAKDGGCGRAP